MVAAVELLPAALLDSQQRQAVDETGTQIHVVLVALAYVSREAPNGESPFEL